MDNARLAFGEFQIEPVERLLRKGGQVQPLPVKAVGVLLELLAQPGALVTREQLLERVWRGVIVEDNSLAQAVSVLRRALGDTAGQPRWIETVARHGYRFVGAVQAVLPGPASPEAARSAVEPAATGAAPERLAVLPFRAFDGDPAQDYLGFGLADAVIGRLAGLSGIRVLPTHAVRHLLGRSPDLKMLGRELGVDAVLDGHLRQHGAQLTLSVQLLRVAGGEVLWADRLGETLDDVFEVERRVADRLVATLAPNLLRPASSWTQTTQDGEAYRLYLKGRHAANLLSLDGYRLACAAFEAALQRDPGFALASEGLAYAHLNACDLWLPSKPALEFAEQLAQQALDAQPALAKPLCIQADVALWLHGDRARARQLLDTALARRADDADILRQAAWVRALSGEYAEALLLLERSAAIDPHDLELHLMAAGAYYLARRYAQSIASARAMQLIDPQSWLAELLIGRCLEAQGETSAALACYRQARERAPDVVEVLGDLGRALGLCGAVAEARALLALFDADGAFPCRPAWVRAQILLGLGELPACIDALEACLAERSWFASWLHHAPLLDPLLPDARFQALRRRSVLPFER